MENNQNQFYGDSQSYPPTNYPQYDQTREVMSVGQYLGMFILSAIPVVNVICWIVWLCSKKTNKNKKNYIIATIVLWLIGVVAAIALSLSGVSLFNTGLSSLMISLL